MNWVTLYALLKKKINDAIGLTNQFVDELPSTGVSGVLYFVPKNDPQDPDQYFMYVWDPDASDYVLLDPDMDLSIYAKSADLANVATSGSYTDLTSKPDLSQYLTKTEGDASYVSYDIYNDKEVTGNPALFYSVSGGNAKSALVTFAPKQSGTGDPSPENIRPISGWDSLSLTRTGKNLLNQSTMVDGYVSSTGSIISQSPTVLELASDYILVSPNTDYVFSVSVNNSLGKWIGTGFYDSNKNFIERVTLSLGIITDLVQNLHTPNNAAYIRVSYRGFGISQNPQVELGSTATAYEPYQGETETNVATFPSTVMGGSYDFVRGSGISNLYSVDMGDLTYNQQSEGVIYVSKDNIQSVSGYNPKRANNSYIISEVFPIGQTTNQYRIETPVLAKDFATAFAGYKLVFELATPTEITLTPADVNLLKGSNTVYTDGDNVDLIAIPVAKELPAVTSSDEGKVLTVDANGNWVAAESEATTALQQQY